MESKYSPKDIEQRWYQYWQENGLFHSEPDGREPFTVVIPPPNVTGVLHMGHVLNETIQDVLVRRARLEGKNACWVPGTDHASIATEAKVIKRLKEQGINKQDLTREEFLKHAWAWTEEHGGIILKQLRTLGCSCDWDRTAFTMDEKRSEAVIQVFCDLYKKGYIYRGLRMVNWDPERQTALSDEEVIYHDEHSHLFYLKYRVVTADGQAVTDIGEQAEGNVLHRDADGYYAVVATTRPETIMGDIAVCINPKDPANQWLKGRYVRVPKVGRIIPIIEDRYVEIGFGTGCLKVTPAHDVNDYALGQKYNLKTIDIFTADAHLNMDTLEAELQNNVSSYHGMDRFECRKQIISDLQTLGLVEKIEDYDNKVGYSERTNVPIEPRLSLQWFVRMQHFADIALAPVMNDEIQFYPTKYKNTYRNWLENIKDWCISRQLWWGHRIPAYYFKDIIDHTGAEAYPENMIIVASTLEEAQNQAKAMLSSEAVARLGYAVSDRLIQDEGALDTWFSSWLWPVSLFDGIAHPNNKEIQYYYPTADLVTGPDIIFFWVARMIMAGYEYTGKMPFRHVYFTGIVRDKLGRKMSKSLGNSPDPLDLIERYGADGVRMGILLSAPAGNDILYDDSLCEQGRNFCNKIWNCFRLIKGWEVVPEIKKEESEIMQVATRWFEAMLSKTEWEVGDLMKKYRLSEALMAVYKLFTDEFSSWYLEMIKPKYGEPITQETYDSTLLFFERMLRLLHPFMPFITEELWQNIMEGKEAKPKSIMVDRLGEIKQEADADALLQQMEEIKQVITGVRNIRAQKNIPPKEKMTLVSPVAVSEIVNKLAGCEVQVGGSSSSTSASFIVGTTEYSVPLDKYVNVADELKKLEADLQHQEGFLKGVMAKLNNERFVANAKPEVVAMERKKQHDAEARIEALKKSIETLKNA
ncbi:MAG: valine--tRNA ligase [Paludibacteraceae bacterium]|nr:valine--tRNA ligase [Paludibacteraceae bacterium]